MTETPSSVSQRSTYQVAKSVWPPGVSHSTTNSGHGRALPARYSGLQAEQCGRMVGPTSAQNLLGRSGAGGSIVQSVELPRVHLGHLGDWRLCGGAGGGVSVGVGVLSALQTGHQRLDQVTCRRSEEQSVSVRDTPGHDTLRSDAVTAMGIKTIEILYK